MLTMATNQATSIHYPPYFIFRSFRCAGMNSYEKFHVDILHNTRLMGPSHHLITQYQHKVNSAVYSHMHNPNPPPQVLLQLARGLFEDTTSLEVVVRKIMVESQELVPCERCTVMLIDQENKVMILPIDN